jgi:hypothetical protein
MPFLRTLLVLASCGVWATSAGGQTPYDVVVYGGTSAGVTAAVQAVKHAAPKFREIVWIDISRLTPRIEGYSTIAGGCGVAGN